MTKSLLALPLAAALAACTGGSDATLTVVNDSDYTIHEIYLTETNNSNWGPNLLRGDVLFPDEEFVLGVPCDFYDALVVDEDDVQCEVTDLDLCLNDATWVIRNNTCAVFDVEAKKRAEGVKQPSLSL
ncbi:MAG TPA: hypothetical protein VK427_07640 [Kofleriaceae bacterium]|nr:hypothetical protein [Kofleriaceae bacterium]